jgi:voltage-gated potassium channel
MIKRNLQGIYRKKTYMVLERESHSKLAELVHYFLMILIMLTVVAVILESDPILFEQNKHLFKVLEIVSLTVFTVEYILRVWSSGEIKKYRNFKGRIRYMLTPMAIVDLLAVLPVWFGLFIYRDFMILRGLRLIRVFKLTRYSRSMNLLMSVMKQESANLFSAFFVLSILIIIAATGMHIVEAEFQPEQFGTIPKSIWWATVTLTTVGYGDVVPITAAGKIFGIFIVMSGIGMAALPAGILASGFTKEINRRKDRFRNRVINYLADGILDKKERKKLNKLAHELAIPNVEANSVIRDIKNMQLKITELACPHCNTPIEIEHYSDHIHLKPKSRYRKYDDSTSP